MNAQGIERNGERNTESIGVIVVDHGSKRDEANLSLESIVEAFALGSQYEIVEPAHMELAEPSIASAFKQCVERGAKCIIVIPYFLAPGNHSQVDIPALCDEAVKGYPGLQYRMSEPVGLHPLMQQVIESQLAECVKEFESREVE